MAITPQRFIDALRDFSLLEPGDLAAVEPEFSAAPQSGTAELAGRLVRAGKLTEYQTGVIADGSARDLVYGEYIVLDQLGAGGMGRVFKARHRRMKRLVALKVLPGEAMQDPAAVQRFGREVEAAAALSHPNIVTAFDAGEANGAHFLVMEYVEGRDLLAVSCERGILPLDQALDYTLQAARGLAYAHSRGVVHRDIKPANLLLDVNGVVKVLDMGVARFTYPDGVASREITVSGEVMGSADYMAPEQASDVRLADARADIYGLGYSLFRLLTGTTPYGGDSFVQKVLAHREQPVPPLSARRPDVPPELEAVYQKMVAKLPEDRYRDMAEVIAALEACRQSLPPAAALPAAAPGTSTPEDETLSPTMFSRQQAASAGAEAATGRSLVPIEMERNAATAPHPSTDSTDSTGSTSSPQASSGLRWRQAVPAIAGAGVLSVVVVAGLAYFKGHRQTPVPAPGPSDGAGKAFVDAGGNSKNPAAGVPPATTATATSPASPPTPPASLPAPDQTLPSADRIVAEWAIGLGGQVGIRPPDSKTAPFWAPAIPYLPSEDFRVCRVMVFQIKGVKITDQDLLQLRDLPELEDLNLGGCVARVTNRGMAVLGQIKSLNRLNLDGASIDDDGIACLRPLTDMSVLSVSSTGITDRGLESLRDMSHLERLYLDHTAVTDAVALKAKTSWPLLSELALPDGAVTDRGLSSLGALQRLKSLMLSQTPISNGQLRLLADIKGLRNLKLDSTPISDAGLANLESCTGLTSISIRDTNVTAVGIGRLRKALPNCTVDSGAPPTKPANP